MGIVDIQEGLGFALTGIASVFVVLVFLRLVDYFELIKEKLKNRKGDK